MICTDCKDTIPPDAPTREYQRGLFRCFKCTDTLAQEWETAAADVAHFLAILNDTAGLFQPKAKEDFVAACAALVAADHLVAEHGPTARHTGPLGGPLILHTAGTRCRKAWVTPPGKAA